MTIADAVHDRYAALPVEALYYCFPVAAGAMLVRFILTEELALFFAIVLACLAGGDAGQLARRSRIYALVGSLVAADRIARAKDRVGIFRAGLVTGARQPGRRAVPLRWRRARACPGTRCVTARCSPSSARRWRRR